MFYIKTRVCTEARLTFNRSSLSLSERKQPYENFSWIKYSLCKLLLSDDLIGTNRSISVATRKILRIHSNPCFIRHSTASVTLRFYAFRILWPAKISIFKLDQMRGIPRFQLMADSCCKINPHFVYPVKRVSVLEPLPACARCISFYNLALK